MKYAALIFVLLVASLTGYGQTVENIRVVQDGDNLKITYRIGAATDAQIFNVFLTCSMDGGRRFEPNAVIGDVGENIVGGKSFYTIIWDVFEDVEEVVNPEFFVKVDMVSDASTAAVPTTTRSQETVSQPAEQKTVRQEPVFEPTFEEEVAKPVNQFERNGFFSYNGIMGFGVPLGISFGSLNSVGYYVTPLRIAWSTYDVYDFVYQTYETEVDLTYMASAGVTKHFVSAGGFYRLHGYWGLGGHLNAQTLIYDPYTSSHVMLETGIINVLGGFNITLGISYSIGYIYATNFVFGFGFVF